NAEQRQATAPSHEVLTKSAVELGLRVPGSATVLRGRRIPMSPQEFLEVEYQRETIVLTPATNLGEFRCQEVEAAKEWVIQLSQEPEIKKMSSSIVTPWITLAAPLWHYS